MLCPSCQFEIDESAGFSFCPKCGGPIATAAPAAAPPAAPAATPAPPAAPAAIPVVEVAPAAAAAPSAAEAAAEPVAAASDPNQKSILIVEDDLFIRELYQKHLEMAGYQVDTGVDGMDGKEKILANSYSIILLDIMLPRMNGLDVLKQIKEEGPAKDVPVIILSNLGQDSVVSRGLALGAVSYIIKSDITPAEMVKLIQEQIGK